MSVSLSAGVGESSSYNSESDDATVSNQNSSNLTLSTQLSASQDEPRRGMTNSATISFDVENNSLSVEIKKVQLKNEKIKMFILVLTIFVLLVNFYYGVSERTKISAAINGLYDLF